MDQAPEPPEARVIIVKNIPHGFYENEMRRFFSQFGKVTRLRLLRSRKYLQSKGVAFIEFEYGETAKIAAEAMDNYLMFEKLLKCQVVPPEKMPPKLFKGWKTMRMSSIEIHQRKAGRMPSPKEWIKLKKKKLRQIVGIEKKLGSYGLAFKCHVIETIPEEDDVQSPIPISTSNRKAVPSIKKVSAASISKSSKDSPKSLRKLTKTSASKYRAIGSCTSMKRKLMSLPKFAILRAAKRLSL